MLLNQTLPLRLAYLVSRYPAVSHTFILREVSQLRARGFEIEVASINAPDRAPAAMTDSERTEAKRTYMVKAHGVRGALAAHLWGLLRPLAWLRGGYHALRAGGWNLQRSLYGLFYFTEALMLWRWMENRKLDHLHVHFATAAANVALLLKQIAPIGLSITVHGPDEFYDAPGQRLKDKIAMADFIICIGAFARSQLMHLSPASDWHKLEVCPLGVDLERYTPKLDRELAPFTILCVGRLCSAKGQPILIEACRSLVAAGRPVRLVLVGTGPDEVSLKTMVAKAGLTHSVVFTGALNESEVRGWYARADAFALASFAEGIPVVLMEAMASGIPCVTTRITGIPELIRDGIDGLLVAPSDAVELASALSSLMDDPDLRADLARNGRARVAEKYDLTRNIDRLGELFVNRLKGATS
ncbi:MAG: glycosyltransferase family 4 protein [Rhodocyclaceae bacterium]|nr:glycosyltransferase family 4 protein [Rhodocyclaceae bacterium]MDZ4216490.1 glycosyltransferase family 4 protein [Rhodocyclaceae bacterium]